jgi:hypothetical protein
MERLFHLLGNFFGSNGNRDFFLIHPHRPWERLAEQQGTAYAKTVAEAMDCPTKQERKPNE